MGAKAAEESREELAQMVAGADLVIVEGAGSPAETNLRARDIANLGFARAAGVPIVPAWVDQANRRGGIGEPIWPSDDYAADLAQIAAFYRAHRPDCPRFERLAAQSRRLAADLH